MIEKKSYLAWVDLEKALKTGKLVAEFEQDGGDLFDFYNTHKDTARLFLNSMAA